MKSWRIRIAGILCATAVHAQDYPAPIRALAARGITIMGTMQAPKGFKGYVGQFSGQLTPVYLLPDGRHVTIGVLYDEQGRDLTNAAFRAATLSRLITMEGYRAIARLGLLPPGQARPAPATGPPDDTAPPGSRAPGREVSYHQPGPDDLRHQG